MTGCINGEAADVFVSLFNDKGCGSIYLTCIEGHIEGDVFDGSGVCEGGVNQSMIHSFEGFNFMGGVGMRPKVAREVSTGCAVFAIDGNKEIGGLTMGQVVEVNKFIVTEVNNERQIGTLGHLCVCI